MKKYNVLSLFDGISCGQQALERANISVNKYYASEIDKFATQVTRYNYPNTIFLGNVKDINVEEIEDIDILIGGSPCQGFSFSGKRKGASGKYSFQTVFKENTISVDNLSKMKFSLDENIKITSLNQYLYLKQRNFEFNGQSYLFWEYIRILRKLKTKNPNLIFLLENVKMETEWKEMFDREVGVTPIRINSQLVSAQIRDRFYWTSKEIKEQPSQKNIMWKDIQLDNASEVMYYSDKAFHWIFKSEKRKNKYKEYTKETNEKMQMVEASHYKGYSNQRCFGIIDNNKTRYIHPIECERLQTIKDNYTLWGLDENGNKIKTSNTQRYKMIGNAWTVEVIAYLLKKMIKVNI